jgi:protein tyrosine phosphatase
MHLTRLIDTYTTRGVPMLVHCRGGVGRAGVVACCWLIKLGLCGWVEPDAELSPLPNPSSPSPIPFDSEKSVPRHLSGPGISPLGKTNGHASRRTLRHDTVHFVERVIAVVRVRRSMKAVETYEQVKFLVDFVEHLREGEMV